MVHKKKGFIIEWKHFEDPKNRWKPLYRGKGSPQDPYKTRGQAEVGARREEEEGFGWAVLRVREVK